MSDDRALAAGSDRSEPLLSRDVSLVEILDRALGAGIVISGDLTISIADVDLVYLNLRLLLGSVDTVTGAADRHRPPDGLRAGAEEWLP
jgi:hypothetical protein